MMTIITHTLMGVRRMALASLRSDALLFLRLLDISSNQKTSGYKMGVRSSMLRASLAVEAMGKGKSSSWRNTAAV